MNGQTNTRSRNNNSSSRRPPPRRPRRPTGPTRKQLRAAAEQRVEKQFVDILRERMEPEKFDLIMTVAKARAAKAAKAS